MRYHDDGGKPQIDGGAVKGLAIFDSRRSPALPNVPTAAEQGTPNLIAYTWNAIFLPKGAPEPGGRDYTIPHS